MPGRRADYSPLVDAIAAVRHDANYLVDINPYRSVGSTARSLLTPYGYLIISGGHFMAWKS
jgi:hypothetical protein